MVNQQIRQLDDLCINSEDQLRSLLRSARRFESELTETIKKLEGKWNIGWLDFATGLLDAEVTEVDDQPVTMWPSFVGRSGLRGYRRIVLCESLPGSLLVASLRFETRFCCRNPIHISLLVLPRLRRHCLSAAEHSCGSICIPRRCSRDCHRLWQPGCDEQLYEWHYPAGRATDSRWRRHTDIRFALHRHTHRAPKHAPAQLSESNELIIPNTVLIEKQVTNLTLSDNLAQLFVTIEVDRTESIDRAIELMLRIAREHPLVLKDKEPRVLLKSADTYYLNFEVHFTIEFVDPMECLTRRSESDTRADQ